MSQMEEEEEEEEDEEEAEQEDWPQALWSITQMGDFS